MLNCGRNQEADLFLTAFFVKILLFRKMNVSYGGTFFYDGVQCVMIPEIGNGERNNSNIVFGIFIITDLIHLIR